MLRDMALSGDLDQYDMEEIWDEMKAQGVDLPETFDTFKNKWIDIIKEQYGSSRKQKKDRKEEARKLMQEEEME